MTSISQFFTSSYLPTAANSTILSLVPKFPGATSITDYRPIACLNTIYKTISRILVKRLKPILSSLIVPNQTAFVKGRLLVENTVLASELINGYHKRSGHKRITLKVDIAKAFDTLSWDFLFNCLLGMHLPERFIGLLQACVCTTSFTLGYNGAVHGFFKGRRGLRQGDPLSPYLFVIALNNLSLMLSNAARDLKIKYHHRCEAAKLTHLCFADDLLIFMDGSIESLQAVLQVLREFELRSGLAISIQKSSFFSSGLTDDECNLIRFTTGLPQGSLPVRYLGVPLCSRKLTLQNCESLIQQVKRKFSSWSVRSLSFAGRLQLIKTVIAGITNFWCSSFVLPSACVKRINSLCGVFLWKGNIEEHHTARVSWEVVTKSKKEGGLGIKSLTVWNKACVLKLIWLLFFQAGSVWVAWFTDSVLNGNLSNFWTIQPSQSNSWLVNKLIKMRGVVYDWIKMRVGNGSTCRFWTDNWTPFGNLKSYFCNDSNFPLRIPEDATLSSLCRDGNWIVPHARSEKQLNLHAHITTLALTENEDYYEWEIEGQISNRYLTGQVYSALYGQGTTVPWDHIVWISGRIPKHSFLCWLFVLNRCPTRDRLLSWGLQTSPNCLLCNSSPESRDHLFFSCQFSWDLWCYLARRCGVLPERTWMSVTTQLQSFRSQSWSGRLILLCWQCCVYWIWQERNSRLHRSSFRSVEAIIKLVDRQIKDKILSYREVNPRLSSRMMQKWLE